ncbi:GDP-mannose 4,6-dehydratase, partial [Methylobacterium oxalidis]|uniref:GDP-mannose 4,6-dehydratase n=1 Tax=Methylobacterium oxalidis TaxID=944322 RepID=UPI0033162352
LNERDWIHVEDHARGLVAVLERGRVGQTYLLGGRAVRNNLSVVKALCAAFDRLRPQGDPHERLITFVADRPGHDRRYAIDPSKAEAELGWAPTKSFEAALEDTIRWYLDNEAWWRPIREGRYQGERLGLAPARKAG